MYMYVIVHECEIGNFECTCVHVHQSHVPYTHVHVHVYCIQYIYMYIHVHVLPVSKWCNNKSRSITQIFIIIFELSITNISKTMFLYFIPSMT